MANWDRVMDIIQSELRYGRLMEECTLQAVVLLPNGNGGVPGYWDC